MGHEKLSEELAAGSCVIRTEDDLEEFLSELTARKNHWFHRGGFTPLQLVFGENPRVPHELLSDDMLGEAGLAELHMDPITADSAAAEFSHRQLVRSRARERAIERHSKDRIAPLLEPRSTISALGPQANGYTCGADRRHDEPGRLPANKTCL